MIDAAAGLGMSILKTVDSSIQFIPEAKVLERSSTEAWKFSEKLGCDFKLELKLWISRNC